MPKILMIRTPICPYCNVRAEVPYYSISKGGEYKCKCSTTRQLIKIEEVDSEEEGK